MSPCFVQERSRSTKVIEEGDDGLKKIECLRGRLLAERQASKIAKQNAESITNKLTELEKKLKEETKLRDRAEKKLKLLKQKLGETVQVQASVSLPGSEESSCVSENSLGSCESSTMKSNLGTKNHDPDEEEHQELRETKSTITHIVENSALFVVETSKSGHTHDIKSRNDCVDSRNKEISEEILLENRHLGNGNGNVKTDEQSCSSEVGSEDQHGVDNSLALVPITIPESKKTKTKELVITDQSVVEALEALRLARERIENTLRQRKHMIKVSNSNSNSNSTPDLLKLFLTQVESG